MGKIIQISPATFPSAAKCSKERNLHPVICYAVITDGAMQTSIVAMVHGNGDELIRASELPGFEGIVELDEIRD